MRFINPLKAVPGPSSMNRVKPCASNVRIECLPQHRRADLLDEPRGNSGTGLWLVSFGCR